MQKTPFLTHSPHFWAKQNFPLNSALNQFFKILIKYHCVNFLKKINEQIPSNTGFKRTHKHTDGEA